MTEERFRQIRRLYEAVAATTPEQCNNILDQQCQGDDDLRREVERLLVAQEHGQNWFRSSAMAAAKL